MQIPTNITPELLASLAGVLLTLILSYVPTLNVKYAAMSAQTKSLINLGCLLAIAVGIVLLSCTNVMAIIACQKADLIVFVQTFIFAMIANATSFTVLPQTAAVKAAKASRPVA